MWYTASGTVDGIRLQRFVEAIKWDVSLTNRLVCEALCMGKVEIAEIPALKSFLCLCHYELRLEFRCKDTHYFLTFFFVLNTKSLTHARVVYRIITYTPSLFELSCCISIDSGVYDGV